MPVVNFNSACSVLIDAGFCHVCHRHYVIFFYIVGESRHVLWYWSDGVCCSGEYPVPGIHQTADTFFQLWTPSSAPSSSSISSSSSSSNATLSTTRMSYELWVLTGAGDSSSRPDLSINPLQLQQNLSFYNRSVCLFLRTLLDLTLITAVLQLCHSRV